MGFLKRLLSSSDRFTTGLVISVILAVIFPCRGVADTIVSQVGDIAVMLLFFLYGAKLSRRSVLDGLMHWRLQSLVAFSTFVMIPALGLLLCPFLGHLMTPELTMGLLYVCMLPSTVQSSIAFTSIAGGNVAAAVCAASVSSLLGVFVTPLLVGLFVTATGDGGGLNPDSFINICYIILLPFVLGQIAQRWIGEWVRNHRNITSWTDQTTIWIVVYSAFSHAMVQGVWKTVPPLSLLGVVVSCAVILTINLILTSWMAKRFKFSREDRIAIIFCGSKKSLATGIPMMNVIFPASALGLLVLPLMIFHQMQLMVCAWLAKRWGKEAQK